jgi:CubicO group peptidase (beta-lactamase class C family)
MDINYKINEYFDVYTQLWPFSGVVSVVREGEVIFSKGYGMANIEHSAPNTTKTKYKIASLTKQFTCAGIMILQERGLLNVQDSITKFFPDYPEFDERITIHHLMTHTSGLFNYLLELNPYFILGKFLLAHKEIFDLFKDMPPEFQPGEEWSYCYFGYYLLGVIIERVSGKSYIEFLKENIFKPLDMNDTGLDGYFEILPNKVSGYYASGERLVCGDIDTMSAFSSGAIYSSIEDMLLWDQALYGDKILSKKSKDEMFTPGRENYGYGWFIDKNLNRKRVRHSGGGNGFNHQLHRYIDDKVTILVLSNYGFVNSFKINEDIASIVFAEEYCLPSKPKAFNLDLQVYESYIGAYQDQWCKFEVKRDGEQLYFVQEDKWIMPIYPISESKFHHTWIDQEYNFEKDDKGQLYFNGVKKIH